MAGRRLLFTSLVAQLALLAGCSTTIDISLEGHQLPGVAVIPGAEHVSLDVVARDARTQFQDRVGSLRSNYKKIVANTDVVDLVRSDIEQLFKDQGFVVAAGGLIVTVEVQNFYFDSNFGTASNVLFTLRVRNLAGRTFYSRTYEGVASTGMSLSSVGEVAKKGLTDALDSALQQVKADTALQRALLSAGPQSKTAPVPTKSRP